MHSFYKKNCLVLSMLFVTCTYYSGIIDFLKGQSWYGNKNCNFEDYENYIKNYTGDQDNPCLIEIVRKKFIVPPSILPTALKGRSIEERGNIEKWRLLKRHIMDKNGFFIECGANDGEYLSTTLHLEQNLNWTGLLIEANPYSFEQMKATNRKAWMVNAALCASSHIEKVNFYAYPNSTDAGAGLSAREFPPVSVQCIPLYTLLKALNVSVVDYFSLDVEKMDFKVLKTIPFEKVIFKLITVEDHVIPEGKAELRRFMKSKGYHFIKEIHGTFTADSAFAHESVIHRFR